MKKTNILGIDISNITMDEALKILLSFLEKSTTHMIFTPNAEIMMQAQRDSNLKNILNSADMLIADGAGVVLASKILGKTLPEKVSGIDLVKNSFNLKTDKPVRYFFLGAKTGIAEKASSNILSLHPNIEIAGFHDGYFNNELENKIINNINSLNVDILLVALGAPRQEKWIFEHINNLNAKICIGVGGSFDIFSGNVKLAPAFFRNNGLEWLYRLCKEPYRFKRMLDLPRFMLLSLAVRLKIK